MNLNRTIRHTDGRIIFEESIITPEQRDIFDKLVNLIHKKKLFYELYNENGDIFISYYNGHARYAKH